MMAARRHELLGAQLSRTGTSWASGLLSGFAGLGNYPPAHDQLYMRTDDIRSALDLVGLVHLEYASVPTLEAVVGQGVDVVLDYFLGGWCQQPSAHQEYYRSSVDKTHPLRKLIWFKPFSEGLLLAIISERWADVARLCSWIDADLKPEYSCGKIEDELGQVYISIAAGLRPEPMPNLQEAESAIAKCRVKRPKLLFRAWEAARNGDQKAFDRAMLESLSHFDKSYQASTFKSPIDWTAQHQSTVCLAARRLGLRKPDLHERLDAMLISRESLGLGAQE